MKVTKIKHNKRRMKRLCSVSLTIALTATSLFYGPFTRKEETKVNAASTSIQSFHLNDITMTDPYCTNAFQKEVSYLLSFDMDKLLAGFRENAGLSTNNATRYGGWESCLIAGHTLGHYLSALAQAYNNPSLSATQKEQLHTKITTLVDGLLDCQRHTKGKSGFIWAAQVKDGNVEGQFDNVEKGKTNIITESWVPWYTMHKLLAGLCDVYNLTNYNNAKTVASALGDWTYHRCSNWSASTHKTVLSIEYGGMNDCLYELYKITGKDTHAIAAHYFDQTDLFERIQTGNENVLNNLHANTTIPKFIGALKRYTIANGKTINGSKVDASAYLKYAKAFWDIVVDRHTYITGGNSEWEHFGEDYKLDCERTNCNCETCNVYNMLKLSRELFQITGERKYMDYYETTYYNSILSSQNPDNGMTTYFQPMASGYFKVYSSPFNNFWCCTGSGMENFTKLGDTIYMHKDNTLYINLYQSSKLSWEDKQVVIAQDSQIPNGDTSTFTLHTDHAADLELRFRIPDWCTGTMTLKKNGTPITYQTVDGYAMISDTFANNDVITVTIPESVVAYHLPDATDSYAFKYGPIVLSAELGTKDMTKTTTGMNVTIPEKKIISSERIQIDPVIGSVSSFMKDINNHMKKDSSSLTFTLTDTDTPLTFTPHYLQHSQRYAIYLYYSGKTSSSSEYDPADITTTDTVQPGYGQYECDELHSMIDNGSVGITNDGTYRYAKANGSFTYRMALDETAKMKALVVIFRKADNGKTIKIKIGNTILYNKTLNYTGDDDSYPVRILIPERALKNQISTTTIDGKDYKTIQVSFSSGNGQDSARICDFLRLIAITPLYEIDPSIAYYVNCGDHDPTTASAGDKFGMYNSMTEHIYGTDDVSGYSWGLLDDPTDQYHGSSKSHALYTANTWPDEYHTSDSIAKSSSFRYTKNQYENHIDRHLDYSFELPNGTYDVEIGFKNPWNCSNMPSVYANLDTTSQAVIASDISVNDSATVKGSVKVTDGTLTLNFRSKDKAINVSYIIIHFNTLDPLPVEEPDSPLPTPTPTAPVGKSDISYDYAVVSDWGSSFQGELVITNNSKKTYDGWTLTCDYDSQITNLWGADFVGQTGSKVSIKNPSWNSTLAPGSSITIDFIATAGSNKDAPTNYILN